MDQIIKYLFYPAAPGSSHHKSLNGCEAVWGEKKREKGAYKPKMRFRVSKAVCTKLSLRTGPSRVLRSQFLLPSPRLLQTRATRQARSRRTREDFEGANPVGDPDRDRDAMSEVFEGYERQYCEASASLTRKCTAAAALQGGNPVPPTPKSIHFLEEIFGRVSL